MVLDGNEYSRSGVNRTCGTQKSVRSSFRPHETRPEAPAIKLYHVESRCFWKSWPSDAGNQEQNHTFE